MARTYLRDCLLDAHGLHQESLGHIRHGYGSFFMEKVADDKQRGGQIDLVIKRADRIVHLCEMKFSKSEYRITDAYEQLLRQRMELFQSSTKTKLSLVITLLLRMEWLMACIIASCIAR